MPTDKDIIPQTQNNVSESAITRMKQKIENLVQDRFQKGNLKSQNKDNTKTR